MSAGHSSNVRLTVFKRDDWTCRGCGFRQTEAERRRIVALGKRGRHQHLTIDHIVPKAKGGSSRLENLQTLCNVCNRLKADTFDAVDATPLRVKGGARSKLLSGLHRSRDNRMLLHDSRCDATFCINTCPVYLERGVFL